jgi:hypothetical protein
MPSQEVEHDAQAFEGRVRRIADLVETILEMFADSFGDTFKHRFAPGSDEHTRPKPAPQIFRIEHYVVYP